MKEIFEQACQNHLDAVKKSFSSAQIVLLTQISDRILHCFKSGGKVMICGNGGSAADSQHIAAEFVGRFNRERRSLPSLALTTDTSIITAVGNDYSYEDIFSRQVQGLGNKGDILIAISTSGNSLNILKAVQMAKEMEILTIGFTGESGGKLKEKVDFLFHAQSKSTPHIQEVHITVLHAISEAVEKMFIDQSL